MTHIESDKDPFDVPLDFQHTREMSPYLDQSRYFPDTISLAEQTTLLSFCDQFDGHFRLHESGPAAPYVYSFDEIVLISEGVQSELTNPSAPTAGTTDQITLNDAMEILTGPKIMACFQEALQCEDININYLKIARLVEGYQMRAHNHKTFAASGTLLIQEPDPMPPRMEDFYLDGNEIEMRPGCHFTCQDPGLDVRRHRELDKVYHTDISECGLQLHSGLTYHGVEKLEATSRPRLAAIYMLNDRRLWQAHEL